MAAADARGRAMNRTAIRVYYYYRVI